MCVRRVQNCGADLFLNLLPSFRRNKESLQIKYERLGGSREGGGGMIKSAKSIASGKMNL